MPSAKTAEAIRASLGRLYGPEVEVHYYDVANPAIAHQHANLLDEWLLERIPFPVVMLDGAIVYAGTINPLRVVATVAAARRRRLAGPAS